MKESRKTGGRVSLRAVRIPQTVSAESGDGNYHNDVAEISQTESGKSAKVLRISDKEDSANDVCQIPRFTLGWSHDLLLKGGAK